MRVALITGASRGVGHAIAAEFLRLGYALATPLRRPETLPADLAGPHTFALPYDATSRGEDAVVAAALERFGRLDALVLNAGVLAHVGLETCDPEADDAALDHLFEVNVKAPFRMARAALPALKVSGAGRAVVVSSLSGKRVLGLNVGYQMSKHAVTALAHAIRRAGWEQGVRCVALCPGFVATDMTAHVSELAAQDMTQPQDLARLVGAVVTLPNSASVAELMVNCRHEATL
jgi:NAD(P)-dependent dehydrogenase (short-subunit alcohol dehydrogenase family)